MHIPRQKTPLLLIPRERGERERGVRRALERAAATPLARCSSGCSGAPAPPSPSCPPRVVLLKVTPLNADTVAPYGQVICPYPDGTPFSPNDAQLELSRGIPRFYLMRLKNRTWQFDATTHHANTTLCLGSLHGLPWYIGVAGSTILGAAERVDPDKCSEVLNADGYKYMPPAVEDIRLFRVDGSRFLKLHVGTWHAAPLFQQPYMEFYNFELSNTNEVDHPNYFFKSSKGVVFEVENPCAC